MLVMCSSANFIIIIIIIIIIIFIFLFYRLSSEHTQWWTTYVLSLFFDLFKTRTYLGIALTNADTVECLND